VTRRRNRKTAPVSRPDQDRGRYYRMKLSQPNPTQLTYGENPRIAGPGAATLYAVSN